MKKDSLYAMFEANPELELNGVVIDYGRFKFKVARAGGANVHYAKTLDAVSKKYQRAIKQGVLDQATSLAILVEVYAKSVILGWEGVTDREGNELPFTVANCINVMTDLPDLFVQLQDEAGKLDIFRKELLEEDAKN